LPTATPGVTKFITVEGAGYGSHLAQLKEKVMKAHSESGGKNMACGLRQDVDQIF
jgi:uncharacterized protein YheU (UPF0270 family)